MTHDSGFILPLGAVGKVFVTSSLIFSDTSDENHAATEEAKIQKQSQGAVVACPGRALEVRGCRFVPQRKPLVWRFVDVCCRTTFSSLRVLEDIVARFVSGQKYEWQSLESPRLTATCPESPRLDPWPSSPS